MNRDKRATAFSTKIVKLGTIPHLHAWHPPTDLFETDQEFIVRVEIAGMSEQDISVNYEGKTLFVIGKRSTLDSKCAYHRMEIPYGDFFSEVSFPDIADIIHASALYENGFLTIRIPKSKPINVKISTEGKN